MRLHRLLPLLLAFLPFLPFLSAAAAAETAPYRTENVFLVVIDGVRWSEGFGDEAARYIPEMARRLAPLGVVSTAFYNDGATKTVPGHASLVTGRWQTLDNGYHGVERTQDPTLFEYWRKSKSAPATDALVVSSKRKLKGLAWSRDRAYGKLFGASADAGSLDVPVLRFVSSGLRDDAETFRRLERAMRQERPRVVLVNLRETDTRGHGGDWEGYLAALRQADRLVGRLWDEIEASPFYAGRTALLVTNDHGRHLDSAGGFSEHGCSCDGCRHIQLLALGPDFRRGATVATRRTLVDVLPTVARLTGLAVPPGPGSVMEELLAAPEPAPAPGIEAVTAEVRPVAEATLPLLAGAALAAAPVAAAP